MRYGSVCSGVEAATLAWDSLGWECAWHSEIDPFACQLLSQRFPDVPNLGDLNNARHHESFGEVDLLVGGTPCQSFSVAGKRGGLDDPRGQLVWSYLDTARASRARWLVWENVRGALSSAKGQDFAAFIGELTGRKVEWPGKRGWYTSGWLPAAGPEHYGIAWRVLDAQYVRVDGYPRAVPQRRQRVFIVGRLGATAPGGDWRRAHRAAIAVLFEPESLQRHPEPRRKTRAQAARAAVEHPAPSGSGFDLYNARLTGDRSGCIDKAQGEHRGHGVLEHLVFDETQITHPENRTRPRPGQPAPTLAARARPPTLATYGVNPDTASPIVTKEGATYTNEGNMFRLRNVVTTALTGSCPRFFDENSAQGNKAVPLVGHDVRLRRLTPRECERLQGFPDDWTAITYRKKPAKDGPRYKAIGNSMAVNVMRWIGQRVAVFERLFPPEKT